MASTVLINQPRKIDIITAIATECEDGGAEDRCAAAHNMIDCGLKSADKHGFDMAEFI